MFKAFFKEVGEHLIAPLTVFLWLATSLIMTIGGPFGTYVNQNYSYRGLFWLTLIGLSLILAISLRTGLRHFLSNLGALGQAIGMSILMPLTFTPALMLLITLAGAPPVNLLIRSAEYAGYVLIVTILVSVARWVFGLQQRTPARLMGRLPEERRWDNVIRLSSRDHYVEVVTDKSSETLLMRFSDALDELEGIDGLRVHRSHWVALDAVDGLTREAGRLFLLMRDGSRVPVSRGYLGAVRESGLLARAA